MQCSEFVLPLITAPPYVYNPDAVHLTPTAQDSALPLITAPPYVYNPDAVHLTPTAQDSALPLITAPPYVYNPDAVHLTPTANVADVYAQCDVCGESGCECEWPRDSDGNLIPADEYCHLCYGNLMQCDCDESFPNPDILLHAKEAECIHELCGHAYLDCHCFSTLCDSNGDSIPYNEFCFRCNGSTRECDCEPLSLPVNTTKEKNWIDIYIAVQAHKFLCSIGVFHRNSYSQTIIPREYGDVCPQ